MPGQSWVAGGNRGDVRAERVQNGGQTCEQIGDVHQNISIVEK
jgi:hypothetical protein